MGCEICGASDAPHTCSLCGRKVCSKHYDESRKLCAVCIQALCEICGEKLSTTYCQICGRYICTDCSVQITPALRVCKECYERYGYSGITRILEQRRQTVPRTPPLKILAQRIAERHRSPY